MKQRYGSKRSSSFKHHPGPGDAPVGHRIPDRKSRAMFSQTGSTMHGFNGRDGAKRVVDDANINPHGSPMRGGIRL